MPQEKWFFDKFPAWLARWLEPVGPWWHLWPGHPGLGSISDLNTENNKLKQEPLSDLAKENTFLGPCLGRPGANLFWFSLMCQPAPLQRKKNSGPWAQIKAEIDCDLGAFDDIFFH